MPRYLSIAIVSWNTKDVLRQCLKSVYANLDSLDAEVIVVDNASSDGSADMVAEAFPQVNLIRCQSNGGFAHANNVAFRQSSGKYFLLLNSDTIVLPDALSALVAFMEDSPQFGAVAPKLLNQDGSLQRSCSCFPSPLTELFDALYLSKLFPRSKLFGRYAMSFWDFDEPREVDFAGGSCLLLRRSALEHIGLLDEDYFMYTEETDLCYRLKLAQWKVGYIPNASIVHLGGQSSKLRPVEMAVQIPVSRHRFVKKFHGPLPAALFRGAVAIGGFLRLIALAPFWVIANEKRPALQQRIRAQGRLLTWAVTGGRQ